MVTLTDLRCAYGDKQVVDIPAFQFEQGVHGIVGLNGSGKTTLMNALYGFGRSKGAKVELDGSDLSPTNTAFQEAESYFYPGITGREYLQLFKRDRAVDRQRFVELLEVPLDELITSYSTGMRRKLAILGVLHLDREVLLFDEPMNGLDLASVRMLEAIVQRLQEEGRTVFITSHVLGPLVTLCKRIHLLAGGTIERSFERGATEGLEQALFADLDKRTQEVLRRSV